MPEQSCRLFRKRDPPPHAPSRGEVGPEPSAPSVEQRSKTSPGQEPPGKRKKTSKGEFAESKDTRADDQPGEARLIRTTHGDEPNDRACLVRAIAALLEGASKEAFLVDALEAIPSDRAPCPTDLVSVLEKYDFALVRASKDYFLLHVPRWQNILEDDCCSIVIRLTLGGVQHHFVGYDENTIHDAPYKLKVCDADRSTKESSRACFDKLFFDQGSWRIASVYRLVSINHSK